VTKGGAGGIAGAEFLALRAELLQTVEDFYATQLKKRSRAMGLQGASTLRLEQGNSLFATIWEKQIPHEAGAGTSHISYTKGLHYTAGTLWSGCARAAR